MRATILLLVIAMGTAAAQAPEASLEVRIGQEARLDAAVPTPRSVFGWPVGTWHLRHDQLVRYFEVLAEASDRVSLVRIGETHEGRPLVLAIITSPGNHRDLEKIRQRHLAWADRPEGKGAPGEETLVAWLGYGVHGDEPSASNAAPLVAWRLAADRSPEAEALLERTVVILDPCLNPDGFARFAQWANGNRGQVLVGDPEHREHRQPWPGGRTNHYWFDLNRDWLLAAHPESRARLEWFHRWRPNLLTDHHEMGTDATFFFQPGVPSRTNPLTPSRNQELTRELANDHAKVLDRRGTLYFSEERFDDFYYGKGSTYPDVHGGVGILFEQASSRGHLQESVNGELSFPRTIENQYLVSFSSLTGAHARREALIAWQREFYRSARFEAAADPVKGWVFGDMEDPSRTEEMRALLARHRIEVRALARNFESGGRSYTKGAAYVVPAAQPQYRLARSLFERRLEFTDPTFYDVSAWTLPLAFDMPFAEIDAATKIETLLGEVASARTPTTRRITRADDDVALAFDWRDSEAPRLLARILAAGLAPRVATAPLLAETGDGLRRFAAGAIVLPYGVQGRDRAAADAAVGRAQEGLGIEIHGIRTGLTPEGPDLGSGGLVPVDAPAVALVVGASVSAYDAGEIWHLLDARIGLPVTHLDAARVASARLGRYSHIVLVGGSHADLGATARERLAAWVRDGGVLVATEGACAWAGREILKLEEKKGKSSPAESAPPEHPDFESRPAWSDRGARRAERLVAGTIYRGLIDASHPLGFGYEDGELFLFKTSSAVMPRDAQDYADVVVYPKESPRMAGYASAANDARIAGTAAVNLRRLGRGAVVRILDDPAFRGYWLGTTRMFMNAIFFSGAATGGGGDDEVEGH
ncbi:MAG: M14 family metallopeptidase [Planctomycetota bacterium]